MDNNLKQEIIEYIEREEIPGALLLTGKWGSGKTYLIKELSKELNAEKRAAVGIVSLFGINSVTDLRNRVKGEYLKFSLGVFNKPARVVRKYSKVISDSVSLASTVSKGNLAISAAAKGVSALTSYDMLSFFDVKNTVGKKLSIPFIIVFDDFERCENISIKDRLGLINEYIENKEIKAIILADEEKIIGDSDYSEFKEKLISKTIRLNANQESVNSIINSYKTNNKDYYNFILEKKEIIISAYNHSSYNNLRTLKACIYDFERIYNIWIDLRIPIEEIDSVLYKFCAIVYETRADNYRAMFEHMSYIIKAKFVDGEEEDALAKRSEKIKEKYVPDTFSGIPTCVSRWVVDGDWNEAELRAELQRKYCMKELSSEERFLFYHFWDLQQEDITQGMPIVVERAYQGEATRDELVTLLEKIYAVKYHSIPLPCDIDYNRIEIGLKRRCYRIKAGEINEPQNYTYAEDSNIEKDAIPVNRAIKKMESKMVAWDVRRDFLGFLHNNTTISRYSFKNRIIDEFDDEIFSAFLEEYKRSPNHRKRELCLVLRDLYFDIAEYCDVENIKKTIQNISRLRKEVEEDAKTNQDYITVAISNNFITILEEKEESMRKKVEMNTTWEPMMT